jgi:hypothetical protein
VIGKIIEKKQDRDGSFILCCSEIYSDNGTGMYKSDFRGKNTLRVIFPIIVG